MPFIMDSYGLSAARPLKSLHDLTQRARRNWLTDMANRDGVVAAGLRNVVSQDTLPWVIRGLGLLGIRPHVPPVADLTRSGLPAWSFKLPLWLRGAEFWLIPYGLLAFAHRQYLIAIPAAATVVAVSVSMVRLHRAGWRGHRLAPCLGARRDLVAESAGSGKRDCQAGKWGVRGTHLPARCGSSYTAGNPRTAHRT